MLRFDKLECGKKYKRRNLVNSTLKLINLIDHINNINDKLIKKN